MQVMQVMQAMQVMQVMHVLQVMQVRLAHLQVNFRVITIPCFLSCKVIPIGLS